LEDKAKAINHLKDQIAGNVIEIGRHLSEARALCGNGGWEAWLKEEVDFTKRHADRCICVYKKFGSNGTSMSHLGVAKLIELASIPDEKITDEVIEQAESSTIKELKAITALIKNPEGVSEAEKKRIAEESYKRGIAKGEQEIIEYREKMEEAIAGLNDSEKRLKEFNEKIENQEKHIEKLLKNAKDDKEIQKFKDEIEALKTQRKSLFSEMQEIKKLVRIKSKAQELLSEISPIKYMSELDPENVSKIAIETFQIILNTFDKWSRDAKTILERAKKNYE
jgi:predicted  nucleic acid-binding Zn-ribbon protein